MTEESKMIVRADKCASIIEELSKLYDISLEEATDIFYNSDTSVLIEEGVADLQCRSNLYLARCVWDEYLEKNAQ